MVDTQTAKSIKEVMVFMMLSFVLYRNIVRWYNSYLYKQVLFPIFKQIQTETNQSDLEQSRSDFLFKTIW